MESQLTVDTLLLKLGDTFHLAFQQKDPSKFESISGTKLNQYVQNAAAGLDFVRHDHDTAVKGQVVAICGDSNLDFLVNVLALCRLGYTPLLLSPSLPPKVIEYLTRTAEASMVLTAKSPIPILPRNYYERSYLPSHPFPGQNNKTFVLVHTSGSTGEPAIVPLTHRQLLCDDDKSAASKVLVSSPLHHAYGVASLIQALKRRDEIFMLDGGIAQTCNNLVAAITAIRPDIFKTVPFVLRALSQSTRGIQALLACGTVQFSGANCPNAIGNLLVNSGVHLVSNFGCSEAGLLASSSGKPKNAWNYVSILSPQTAEMRPFDGELRELVVLEGHLGRTTSNKNDPPNSFYPGDLFVPHPVHEGWWKHVGRYDDRITLETGQKFSPLAFEEQVMQHGKVQQAVVFGNNRLKPGILVFTDVETSDIDFLEGIWTLIQRVNETVPSYAWISKDMIIVVPGQPCPMTDKGTIKRNEVYTIFNSIISEAYNPRARSVQVKLKLSVPELTDWLIKTCRSRFGIELPSSEADFFQNGIDSHKAVTLRGAILKSIDTGGHPDAFGVMGVLEHGNADGLARHLVALRTGIIDDKETDEELLVSLIKDCSLKAEKQVDLRVALTGATGNLGSHLLSQLIEQKRVCQVYCLVRAPSLEAAEKRVLELETVQNSENKAKIIALKTDFAEPDLDEDAVKALRDCTHIFHCAWSVNFARGLKSFRPELAALRELLSLSQKTAAHLFFCSSMSAVTRSPSTIYEQPILSLKHSEKIGYAQAKLAAECIIQDAVTNYARASILRIGQIVPPKGGLWNPNETIPQMLQLSRLTETLPECPPGGDLCSWIPVDALATSILEISGLSDSVEDRNPARPALFYNLVHPIWFSWRRHFLPALRAAGLKFSEVPLSRWVSDVETKVRDHPLLPVWRNQLQWGFTDVVVDMTNAKRDSPTLRELGELLQDGYVRDLLRALDSAWADMASRSDDSPK